MFVARGRIRTWTIVGRGSLRTPLPSQASTVGLGVSADLRFGTTGKLPPIVRNGSVGLPVV